MATFLTMTVPAEVPSEQHNLVVELSVSTGKYSLLSKMGIPIATLLVYMELPRPEWKGLSRLMSLTMTVPPAVPSVTHSSLPWV